MGLATDMPGFYQDSLFLRAEQRQTAYINKYARFVRDRDYSNSYLSKSETTIRHVATSLRLELQKDGRSNLCVAASKVLSKMLERLGIWNFVIAGSLVVSCWQKGRDHRRCFYTFDVQPGDVAHAWVVAPPFQIIDLTLQQQWYKGFNREVLPKMLLQRDTVKSKAHVGDLCTPALRRGLNLKGIADEDILDLICPSFRLFSSVFAPEGVYTKSALLKYIPVRIITPEGDLDGLQSLTLNKKNPTRLFQRMRLKKGII